jgi:uncharacterized protein (TIGR02246 family)
MSDNDELATRVRRLEDRAELWELVSRYAVAVDDEDYGTLAKLFVPEATFVGLSGDVTSGRDHVIDYLRERASTAHKQRVHTPTSQIVERLDVDRAAGLVCCYAALYGHDGSDSFFAFRYDDDYRRDAGRWCFERRRVHDVKHLPRV